MDRKFFILVNKRVVKDYALFRNALKAFDKACSDFPHEDIRLENQSCVALKERKHLIKQNQ